MKRLRVSFHALGICAAVALLAGCGGSQPPIGAPGAMQQNAGVIHSAFRSSTQKNTESLLYVSGDNTGDVYIYSYPGLQPRFKLKSLNRYAYGQCVDGNGDVFITTASFDKTGIIYEYPYGSKRSTEMLTDPGLPLGCAIDPTTGNLAVSNYQDLSNSSEYGAGDLAIYANAEGPPTFYYSPSIHNLFFCGYDPSGNLYIDGQTQTSGTDALFELPAGSQSLTQISINATIYRAASVQWDGQYMTIVDRQRSGDKFGPEVINRLQLSGNSATIVGTTKLAARGQYSQTLIYQNKALAISEYRGGRYSVGVWSYPAGGRDHRSTSRKSHNEPFGIAISSGPEH